MGYRELHTYSRGRHLHIDDLVTRESARRQGVGTALLAFAEDDARKRNVDWLVLDARPGTAPFYTAVGFDVMPPTPMKRKVT
jgi:GNAT superfamily N-acetyltransferase